MRRHIVVLSIETHLTLILPVYVMVGAKQVVYSKCNEIWKLIMIKCTVYDVLWII